MNSIFATIFELLYNSQMNSDLYDNNIYGLSGIVMLISSIIICFIFYLLFDKAKYSGFLYWFIFLIISALITFFVVFYIARDSFQDQGIDYPISEYLYFSSIVSLFGIIIFFLLSLIVKRFRVSLVHSPF